MKQPRLQYRCRPAEPERDLDTLFAFMQSSFQFLPNQGEQALQQLKSTSFASPSAFKEAYLPSEDEDDGSRMFIVVEDAANAGELVACVGAVQCNPYELELVRLFVREDHRRRGVGEMLVSVVVDDFAKRHGYERVVLYCGYESAQRMYVDRCGFKPCGKYFFWKRVMSGVAAAGAVRHLAVLAGVHGNELIGIHLINRVWKNKGVLDALAGPECKVTTVVCNVEAQKRCVRFVEQDLNRCFALKDLASSSAASTATVSLEMRRAWELDLVLGPKQNIPGSIARWREKNPQGAVDYMLDLHSTTSSMGICFITLKGNAMTLRLARHVRDYLAQHECPFSFNLLVDSDCPRDVNNNIDSVTPSGVCIEVGPLAHGTLNDAALFTWTRRTVEESVRFIAEHNRGGGGDQQEAGEEMPGYELVKPVYFPRNEATGCVTAMLHPSCVGSDFQLLRKGEALFVDLESGDVIPFEGHKRGPNAWGEGDEEEEEEVFPCFYGEAAYFTSGIACWLCRKRQFPVYG